MNSVVTTFTMGSNVLDQQLGCLWQKDHLLSISLSGYINYLDKNNPSKPLRVIKVGLRQGGPACVGQWRERCTPSPGKGQTGRPTEGGAWGFSRVAGHRLLLGT